MAVTITAADLEAAAKLPTGTGERFLAVASALVERFAPSAPDEIQNEAVIRTAGWLHQTPAHSVMSAEAGPLRTSFAAGQLSALRHSGGMSLLSPWKIRRAGSI